jgi:hypothetical protein
LKLLITQGIGWSMTAKELINHLKTLPPETHIAVRGYEDGFNYAQVLREVKVIKNANTKWYYGDLEEMLDADSKRFDEIVWVLQ